MNIAHKQNTSEYFRTKYAAFLSRVLIAEQSFDFMHHFLLRKAYRNISFYMYTCILELY
jgi:hypothetical protein